MAAAFCKNIVGGNEIMKKIITSVLTCMLALFLVTSFTIISFGADKLRLVDNADILDTNEENKLLKKLDSISEKLQFDFVVATVRSLNGDEINAAADKIYDDSDYGYGDEKDGALFLIAMKEREWAISTRGFGNRAFTEEALRYLAGEFEGSLSDGKYVQAFNIYADTGGGIVLQAQSGKSFDKSSLPLKPLGVMWILISAGVAFVISSIYIGGLKAELKSVREQKSAKDYVRANSFNLTKQNETFLYTRTQRMKRRSSSSGYRSSGGRSSSGGSSIRIRSGGGRHGGASGRF